MPIDPVTGTLITQGVIAGVQAISKGGPRRQYKWNKRAANDANQMNRDNALWQLENDKRLQNEQRVYDSPEAQMARYKAAGLNPHLIYGSGSGSAGSAFPITSPSIAASRIDAPSAEYPDVAGTFLQAGQSIAATKLAGEKAAESEQKQALIEVQKDIAKANPMLNPHVYKATIFMAEAVATQKAQESRYLSDFPSGESNTRAEQKIQASIDKMFQDLGLGKLEGDTKRSGLETQKLDREIKNKILESKEYMNALQKIQVEWMKDGDFTPQHIFQGLMLILQKMM